MLVLVEALCQYEGRGGEVMQQTATCMCMHTYTQVQVWPPFHSLCVSAVASAKTRLHARFSAAASRKIDLNKLYDYSPEHPKRHPRAHTRTHLFVRFSPESLDSLCSIQCRRLHVCANNGLRGEEPAMMGEQTDGPHFILLYHFIAREGVCGRWLLQA